MSIYCFYYLIIIKDVPSIGQQVFFFALYKRSTFQASLSVMPDQVVST